MCTSGTTAQSRVRKPRSPTMAPWMFRLSGTEALSRSDSTPVSPLAGLPVASDRRKVCSMSTTGRQTGPQLISQTQRGPAFLISQTVVVVLKSANLFRSILTITTTTATAWPVSFWTPTRIPTTRARSRLAETRYSQREGQLAVAQSLSIRQPHRQAPIFSPEGCKMPRAVPAMPMPRPQSS